MNPGPSSTRPTFKMCIRSALPYLRASLGRSEALCIMAHTRSRETESLDSS